MKPPPGTPTGGWRVVLARVPDAGPDQAHEIDGRELIRHVPVLEDAGWVEASALVERLQGVGVSAALLPESESCAVHPTQLANSHCSACSAWICYRCRADAGGRPLCVSCANGQRAAARLRRLRTLFSLFLFAVFLFQVASYLRREAAALEPPVQVAIIQFAPARLLKSPKLRALNEEDGGAGRSLYDIGRFFDAEHERYTGDDSPFMNVAVRGPWAQDVNPPTLGDRDAPWWELALSSWQYPRYFFALGEAHGVDPDDFGARLYIVWTDKAGDVSGDSRGSKRGRVGISWLSVDEPNPAYSVVTVAHELAHVLGATDTYEEGSYLSRWPEGYVEPFVEPRWPQPWAELMAVDRPTGPSMETEVQSLFDERIGYHTAAHMSWIAPEQAELYYQPRLTTPEEALKELERARSEARAGPQAFGPAPEALNLHGLPPAEDGEGSAVDAAPSAPSAAPADPTAAPAGAAAAPADPVAAPAPSAPPPGSPPPGQAAPSLPPAR